jgi:hypothetical protein
MRSGSAAEPNLMRDRPLGQFCAMEGTAIKCSSTGKRLIARGVWFAKLLSQPKESKSASVPISLMGRTSVRPARVACDHPATRAELVWAERYLVIAAISILGDRQHPLSRVMRHFVVERCMDQRHVESRMC